LQKRLLPRPEKDVTSFVTRKGGKGKEGTEIYRTNGTLQDIDTAKKFGETVAKASFVRNGRFSLLISGPRY
jgi:hypothetical protein